MIHITTKKLPLRLLAKTLLPFLLVFFSCDDFVTIGPPPTSVTGTQVFSDDGTATAAIRGIYQQMVNGTVFASGGLTSVTLLAGWSADEYIIHTTTQSIIDFHTNALNPENGTVLTSLWEPACKYIYYANNMIEGLAGSTGISLPVKRQLEGEAKFIRAFCLFYLVNLFGDIPLLTTTDYRINRTLPRSPADQVYEQIISDLLSAQDLLAEDYSFSDFERVRPNSAAASALLARVYLYRGDWSAAEVQAASVISHPDYELPDELSSVFLKNSMEAIWQLRPQGATFNTREGNTFIPLTAPQFVSIHPGLVNDFEEGDARREQWVGRVTSGNNTFYYPHKYKIRTGGTPLNEYSMVLRLAEQYLIRAEARAQQGNLTGAIADVDAIRQRAALPLVSETNPSISKDDLLRLIESERRKELFSEWGHRWLDLKRTHRTETVLGPVKGSNWQPTDTLYPIPQYERNNNPTLTQNPGY